MSVIQPTYIIPLLVEQPTWGGNYIATQKQLTNPLVVDKKIGQSFELFGGSWVTSASPITFAYATATEIQHPIFADETQPKETLQSWIEQDSQAVLGSKAIQRGWQSMQVLIKFTQAQNNSYQVHVKPDKEFGKWLPKPESWYFVEKGKATLGLADVTKSEEYKKRCLEIDQHAHHLSELVQAGQLTVDAARQQLNTFINQDHPRRFVNTVSIEKGAIIDLSQGGTHHSWEMGDDIPEGNIVYEVQVDVQDEFCTLRSFDQGNIKSDGSVRPLTIEDYFRALDLTPDSNTPSQFLQKSEEKYDQTATVQTLFENQFYVTELLTVKKSYTGKYTETQESFHHLYSLMDSFTVTVGEKSWFVPAGWSFFIPANVGRYQVLAEGEDCQVLITHL